MTRTTLTISRAPPLVMRPIGSSNEGSPATNTSTLGPPTVTNTRSFEPNPNVVAPVVGPEDGQYIRKRIRLRQINDAFLADIPSHANRLTSIAQATAPESHSSRAMIRAQERNEARIQAEQRVTENYINITSPVVSRSRQSLEPSLRTTIPGSI